MKLKHETNMGTARRRPGKIVTVRHALAVDLDVTAIRLVEEAEQIEERGLAAA